MDAVDVDATAIVIDDDSNADSFRGVFPMHTMHVGVNGEETAADRCVAC